MYYDRAGNRISTERWMELFSQPEPDYRVIEQTRVGSYHVSTVWLGIDYGVGSKAPIIFETMVFAASQWDERGINEGLSDIDCIRYSTEDQARRGHAETVLLVQATQQERILDGQAEEAQSEGGSTAQGEEGQRQEGGAQDRSGGTREGQS